MKLQVSLRTVFAVVTVAAVASAWLAHEVRVVQERNAMREWIKQHGGTCTADTSSPNSTAEEPSFVRRWMGDERVGTIVFSVPVVDEDVKRIGATFPGVVVHYVEWGAK